MGTKDLANVFLNLSLSLWAGETRGDVCGWEERGRTEGGKKGGREGEKERGDPISFWRQTDLTNRDLFMHAYKHIHPSKGQKTCINSFVNSTQTPDHGRHPFSLTPSLPCYIPSHCLPSFIPLSLPRFTPPLTTPRRPQAHHGPTCLIWKQTPLARANKIVQDIKWVSEWPCASVSACLDAAATQVRQHVRYVRSGMLRCLGRGREFKVWRTDVV